MKWSIGMKIGAGFALGIAILAALGVISYRNTNGLIAAAANVNRTQQISGKLESVLETLTASAFAQRGYIITGDESYLGPYTTASATVDKDLKDLRQLITNPDQLSRLNALEPLAAAWLDFMGTSIDIRRNKGFKAAQDNVIGGTGNQSEEKILQAVAVMTDAENKLLAERDAVARSSARLTVAAITYGIPGALLIIACVAFLLIRAISVPLRVMAGISDKIAEGNLSATVEQTTRKDEVGTLQRSLRRMSENLRELFSQTQEGIGTLGTSASEILATTTQIASGAAETATGVSETTTTVEEVKQTAQVSSQKARSVMEGAQRSVQVAQTGRKAVEETLAGMDRIREQMELIAGSIVRLSEQSQAIGEIIATVNDLAEQSNLLAVNAAIEAAKAGDQGRGFAVVAQEVKSLATQSKQATAQVRGILGEVQKATSAAVMATEQGTKVVEAGVKQSAEVNEVIRQLGENIAEAAQSSTQIAASSQQQVVGMDQIAQAMESIKLATTQNVAGARQAEAAAQQLHELGESLGRLVSHYSLEEHGNAGSG